MLTTLPHVSLVVCGQCQNWTCLFDCYVTNSTSVECARFVVPSDDNSNKKNNTTSLLSSSSSSSTSSSSSATASPTIQFPIVQALANASQIRTTRVSRRSFVGDFYLSVPMTATMHRADLPGFENDDDNNNNNKGPVVGDSQVPVGNVTVAFKYYSSNGEHVALTTRSSCSMSSIPRDGHPNLFDMNKEENHCMQFGADIILIEQKFPAFPTHNDDVVSLDREMKQLCEQYCTELASAVLATMNPYAQIILYTCVDWQAAASMNPSDEAKREQRKYPDYAGDERCRAENEIPRFFAEFINKKFFGRVHVCPVAFRKNNNYVNNSSAKQQYEQYNRAASTRIAEMILSKAWPLWRTRAHALCCSTPQLAEAFFPTGRTTCVSAVEAKSNSPASPSTSRPRLPTLQRSYIRPQNWYPDHFLVKVDDQPKPAFTPSSVDKVNQMVLQNPGQGILLGRAAMDFSFMLVTEGIFSKNQQVCINSLGSIAIESIRYCHKDIPTNFATAGMVVRVIFSKRILKAPVSGLVRHTYDRGALVTAADNYHGFDVVAHERRFPNSNFFPHANPGAEGKDDDDEDHDEDDDRNNDKHQQQAQKGVEPICDYRLTRRTTNLPRLVQPLAMTLEILHPCEQFAREPPDGADATPAPNKHKRRCLQEECNLIRSFLTLAHARGAAAVGSSSSSLTVVAVSPFDFNVSGYRWSSCHVNAGVAGARAATMRDVGGDENTNNDENDEEKRTTIFDPPEARTVQVYFSFCQNSASDPVLDRITVPRTWNPDVNPPLVRLWSEATNRQLLIAKVIDIVTDLDVVEDFLCPLVPAPCPKLFLSKRREKTDSGDLAAATTSIQQIEEKLRGGKTPGCRLAVGFASPLNNYFIQSVPDHLFRDNINPSSWIQDRMRLQWSHTKWGRYALECRSAPFPVCLSRLSALAVAFNFEEVVGKMTGNFCQFRCGDENNCHDDGEVESTTTTTMMKTMKLRFLPGILRPGSPEQFRQVVAVLGNYFRDFLIPSWGLRLSNVPADGSIWIAKRIPPLLEVCCTSLFCWKGSHSGPTFICSPSSTASSSSSPSSSSSLSKTTSHDSPFKEELFKIAESIQLGPRILRYQFESQRAHNLFAALEGFAPRLDREDFLSRLPVRLLQMTSSETLLKACMIGANDSSIAQRRLNLGSSKIRSTGSFKELYHDSLLVQAVRTWNLDLIDAVVEALVHIVVSAGGRIEEATEKSNCASASASACGASSSSSATSPRRGENIAKRVPLRLIKDAFADDEQLPLVPAASSPRAAATPAFAEWKAVLRVFDEAIAESFPKRLATDPHASATPLACAAFPTFRRLLLGCAQIMQFVQQFSAVTSATTRPTSVIAPATTQMPNMMKWIDVNEIRAPKLRLQMAMTVNRFTSLMGANICASYGRWIMTHFVPPPPPHQSGGGGTAALPPFPPPTTTTTTGTNTPWTLPLPSAPISAVYAELMRCLMSSGRLEWIICQRIIGFLLLNDA